MTKKCIQYAAAINDAIAQAFNEETGIDPAELNDGDNLTDFIHAMATVAPNAIFNRLTGENKNNLEFNHVANQLCMQNATFDKEE